LKALRALRILRGGAAAALAALGLLLLPSPGAATASPVYVLRVTLRGRIDGARLHEIEQAIRRRDDAARALGREVALRVEADSTGGEIFTAMQIGRLLRRAGASLSVRRGASCLSACVFALMGAMRTGVADGARIGIHRPSLGPGHDGPAELTSVPFTLYADEMRVSRRLVDDMLALPPGRICLLSVADLARYGIAASGS